MTDFSLKVAAWNQPRSVWVFRTALIKVCSAAYIQLNRMIFSNMDITNKRMRICLLFSLPAGRAAWWLSFMVSAASVHAHVKWMKRDSKWRGGGGGQLLAWMTSAAAVSPPPQLHPAALYVCQLIFEVWWSFESHTNYDYWRIWQHITNWLHASLLIKKKKKRKLETALKTFQNRLFQVFSSMKFLHKQNSNTAKAFLFMREKQSK